MKKIPQTYFTLSQVRLGSAYQHTPSPHYFWLYQNRSLLTCPVSLSQVKCNQRGEDLTSPTSPQAPKGHQQGQGAEGEKHGPGWRTSSPASIYLAVGWRKLSKGMGRGVGLERGEMARASGCCVGAWTLLPIPPVPLQGEKNEDRQPFKIRTSKQNFHKPRAPHNNEISIFLPL